MLTKLRRHIMTTKESPMKMMDNKNENFGIYEYMHEMKTSTRVRIRYGK